ncbi:MAG: hypothetical protein ABMB14_39585, partial [Myxococcota bacterium]
GAVSARIGGQPELAAAATDAERAEALASAVARVADVNVRDRAALGAALARRGQLGLVLDGFEAVVDGGALLVDWLDQAPELTLLVTSRVRLRVGPERVVELGPLTLADARQLWVARLVDAGVEPVLSPATDALLEGLERLPLAIELAAPRARVMSAEQMVARLGERFRLLGGDPGRRSLRAVLDHSWALLDPRDQRALAWCSVFAGGFTLDAAEAVLTDRDLGWPLDRLEALCDASLIHLAPTGTTDPRYQAYESVREYALHQLDRTGERAAAEAAHTRYYTDRGTALAARVDVHGGFASFGELAAELPNLLAVFRRTLRDDPTTAARILIAIEVVLAMRGPLSLLDALATEVLSDPRLTDPQLRAAVGCVHGETTRARAQSAAHLYEAAFAAVEGSGTDVEIRARAGVAITMSEAGRLDDATRFAEDTLALARAAGLRRYESLLCSVLGLRWVHRDLAVAERWMRKAVSGAQDVGNARREAMDSGNLALLVAERGDLDEAERLAVRAVALHREWGNTRSLGRSLRAHGVALAAKGAFAEAIRIGQEAWAMFDREGLARGKMETEQHLTELRWVCGGDPADAAATFERL